MKKIFWPILFLIVVVISLIFYFKWVPETKDKLIYTNKVYGFSVQFKDDILSGGRWEKKEYNWSQIDKAYNSKTSIAIASDNSRFTPTDSFFGGRGELVMTGDILNIEVFDGRLCADRQTDNAEKEFCQNVFSDTQNSGVRKGDWPEGYWVKNNKFIIFFDSPLVEGNNLSDKFSIFVFGSPE